MHGQEALNFLENAFGFLPDEPKPKRTMKYYEQEIADLGKKADEYRDRSNRVFGLTAAFEVIEESAQGPYQTLPEFTEIKVEDCFCSVPTKKLISLIEEQIKEDLQCDTNPTNA